jgi:hypothetical protein
MDFSLITMINEYRLDKEGRELLDKIKKAMTHKISKVALRNKEFDMLLETVTPHDRKNCENKIPFNGKYIVRMKSDGE